MTQQESSQLPHPVYIHDFHYKETKHTHTSTQPQHKDNAQIKRDI